ncbi:hypothetical protein EVAR_84985_1 [Eumeta japonica]|uniref:Uncharacterized protein n=1 Tax=Eumeta variegata TaxID=151549 RepID=A0A4C1W8N7_EUMVA|nr:hypothetical protein EVAR_84985_1 [Eumeta japonica]
MLQTTPARTKTLRIRDPSRGMKLTASVRKVAQPPVTQARGVSLDLKPPSTVGWGLLMVVVPGRPRADGRGRGRAVGEGLGGSCADTIAPLLPNEMSTRMA